MNEPEQPPLQPTADGSPKPDTPSAKWQNILARWNAILGMEASLETSRQKMEGLRAELDASSNRNLNTDEKVHALNSDIAQWNKAKSRARYALPKAREFIHRATWSMGTPERKKLDEFFKRHIRDDSPPPGIDEIEDDLETLLKDRQILTAQGVTIYQECKRSQGDIQSSLSALQSGAQKRRVTARAKR